MSNKDTKTEAKGLVLVDNTYTLDDGSVMHAYVVYPDFKPQADRFLNALLYARGIPNSGERLSPKDPILTFYTEQNKPGLQSKKLKPTDILQLATSFYKNETTRANSEAVLLAMFDNPETNIQGEVLPYPEEKAASKWLDPDPALPRDLNNRVEAALRQIYQKLASNGTMMAEVVDAAEMIAVKLNLMASGVVEVDANGFLIN